MRRKDAKIERQREKGRERERQLFKMAHSGGKKGRKK